MISELNRVLFYFGNDAVTSAELLGFITGLAAVYYTVRAHILNFPISIINAVFFFILFWHARLFADASIQVMFFVLCLFGWWAWLKAGPHRTELAITDASVAQVFYALAGVACLTLILWPILRNAHDIAPFWDAATTALSVGAQVLLNFKKFQNWFFWIAADLIYIPLYFYKNLYLTGIVYVVFLGLCVAGVTQWQRGKVVQYA